MSNLSQSLIESLAKAQQTADKANRQAQLVKAELLREMFFLDEIMIFDEDTGKTYEPSDINKEIAVSLNGGYIQITISSGGNDD